MVGRPREFDVDEALDAAMQAFWAKGYESTSLTDLMSATGLHKGSIYQAFGDKHTLFKLALRRYLEQIRAEMRSDVESAPSPFEGIRSVGHGMLDNVDSDGSCRGCLAVNSMVELAPHDAEVKAILDEHLSLDRGLLEEAVAAAQDAGQLSAERRPAIVATMIMTFMAGLATTTKGLIDIDEAHDLFDAQLDALR